MGGRWTPAQQEMWYCDDGVDSVRKAQRLCYCGDVCFAVAQAACVHWNG